MARVGGMVLAELVWSQRPVQLASLEGHCVLKWSPESLNFCTKKEPSGPTPTSSHTTEVSMGKTLEVWGVLLQ